jgi:hypothetical protein
MTHRFSSTLWLYNGKAAWHFITLPEDVADEIEAASTATTRGFGSVRVTATIGDTTWATSLFPDNAAQSYLLPVKKPVRTAERLTAGDEVAVVLRLMDE